MKKKKNDKQRLRDKKRNKHTNVTTSKLKLESPPPNIHGIIFIFDIIFNVFFFTNSNHKHVKGN